MRLLLVCWRFVFLTSETILIFWTGEAGEVNQAIYTFRDTRTSNLVREKYWWVARFSSFSLISLQLLVPQSSVDSTLGLRCICCTWVCDWSRKLAPLSQEN